MTPILEIIVVAYFVAAACILIGAFWLVQKNAFLSDTISHSVLIGIVLFYLIFDQISGWGAFVAAALSGSGSIFFIDFLSRGKKISRDGATVMVLSLFLGGSIILITKYADQVHLDRDSILLGELIFVVFDRVQIAGYDLGPKALYRALVVFVVDGLFIAFFYRQLTMQVFDFQFAKNIGRRGKLLEIGFVFCCSITAVVALDAVGVVLGVTFFITPVATAFLFVKRKLWFLFPIAFLLQAIALPMGYGLSYALNASVASSMALVVTIFFFIVFFAKQFPWRKLS